MKLKTNRVGLRHHRKPEPPLDSVQRRTSDSLLIWSAIVRGAVAETPVWGAKTKARPSKERRHYLSVVPAEAWPIFSTCDDLSMAAVEGSNTERIRSAMAGEGAAPRSTQRTYAGETPASEARWAAVQPSRANSILSSSESMCVNLITRSTLRFRYSRNEAKKSWPLSASAWHEFCDLLAKPPHRLVKSFVFHVSSIPAFCLFEIHHGLRHVYQSSVVSVQGWRSINAT